MWTEEERELYKDILGKQSVDTGINVFDYASQAHEEAQGERWTNAKDARTSCLMVAR